ncbi:MAG: SCO family protein [Deltaproteobacteria bacterium]|jgi:protein SCO1/2|nr:SCO family protein [Deltaproteobacteria bacterium]MBW2520181.1 SCO family protein [Deltaproteobacteria bacterium]
MRYRTDYYGSINGPGINFPLWITCLSILSLLLIPVDNAFGIALFNRLENMQVVNQDGQAGDFLADYVGDNIAVITFTYSCCTTACPILDGIFKRVQEQLDHELGRNVTLLTVSIDPANDIPVRLKLRSERLGAKENWHFLTGDKKQIDDLLKAFEVYTPDIYTHPPTVLILDIRNDQYYRLSGFPSADDIIAVLEQYQSERRDS